MILILYAKLTILKIKTKFMVFETIFISRYYDYMRTFNPEFRIQFRLQLNRNSKAKLLPNTKLLYLTLFIKKKKEKTG